MNISIDTFKRGLAWLFSMTVVLAGTVRAADRPNILWITSEDNSPYLGCYGDEQARTPNLDALAEQGVRYINAFANAPVCSVARTTLITGMYPSSLGAQNHRSRIEIPQDVQLFPELLRSAGYYCTNNSKTDYNIAGNPRPWDESSKKVHYRNRPDGMPFFAVFNFTISHESQVTPKPGQTKIITDPATVKLPPYLPDTEAIRRDVANYYDQMEELDQQVGNVLRELEESGLAENTIVFYFSDHGGALPGGKRHLHDSGTRVPLIIRFPERWKELAPGTPGSVEERLVSFVDFAPTVLNIAGVKIPDFMQGRPFLGAGSEVSPQDEQPVFLLRGRMDVRYDTSRGLRTREALYIRNFTPHRPWGQRYTYAFQVQPSMRSWYDEYLAGRCNEIQSAYWLPKASEEFYVPAVDPDDTNNRIKDSSVAPIISQLRKQLRETMIETRDTGFIPEGMFDRLRGNQTIYDYAQSEAYPIARIFEVADIATNRDPDALPKLLEAMRDPHPVIRFWGATGCIVLGENAAAAKSQLHALLNDDWNDVRVAAAEAIGLLGDPSAALKTLKEVLQSGNEYEIFAAQNCLDALYSANCVSVADVQDLLSVSDWKGDAARIPNDLQARMSSVKGK